MNLYRCTFVLTEHGNLVTNMFLRAPDKDKALNYSFNLFKIELKKHGIPNALFTHEVLLSSDEEAMRYLIERKKGNTTHKVVN